MPACCTEDLNYLGESLEKERRLNNYYRQTYDDSRQVVMNLPGID